MRGPLATTIALLIFLMTGQSAEADPISLLFHEGFAGSGVGQVIFPFTPVTLQYSSQGGGIEFMGGDLGTTSSDISYPYPPQQYPINASFGMLLGVPAPGSTNSFQGPVLEIVGQVTGLITGPQGLPGRWSGSYSGTATSVTLNPLDSQDLSQLPAPLLDILNHPNDLKLSVVVDGGNENILDATLTFAPPSANELPEPTALMTLLVGAAGMLLRRRIRRARSE